MWSPYHLLSSAVNYSLTFSANWEMHRHAAARRSISHKLESSEGPPTALRTILSQVV